MADADAVASGIRQILMHKDKTLQDATMADMLSAFRELSRPDGTGYSEAEAKELAKELWTRVRAGARAQVVDGDVNEHAEAATLFAARVPVENIPGMVSKGSRRTRMDIELTHLCIQYL
jgi:hypothetical protein